MNSALFHMARPGDIRDEGTRGRGGGSPGMREAAAVAKEMGFSQEFGPQAANMWKMLDDLAVTDKAAYADMVKAGAEEMRKPRERLVVPIPGWVLKTSLRQPWKPTPTPAPSNGIGCGDGHGGSGNEKMAPVESAGVGTKVFINVCEHEGVSAPIDQADRPVDVTREPRSPAGLRMPMLVSTVRDTTDHGGERALAIDVVFNPWVLRCSVHERHFRSQVNQLAADWIMRERKGLVVDHRCKLLKQSTYKGGSGPRGETPVPFPGEEISMQDKPSPEKTSSGRGNTPVPAEIQGEGGGRTGGAHGNGGGGGGGGSGLLDDSMNDPLSLLAALKNPPAPDAGSTASATASTSKTWGSSGRGSRSPPAQDLSGNHSDGLASSRSASAGFVLGGDRTNSGRRATGTTTTAAAAGGGAGGLTGGEGVAKALGLSCGGNKSRRGGPLISEFAPLISEIVPATTASATSETDNKGPLSTTEDIVSGNGSGRQGVEGIAGEGCGREKAKLNAGVGASGYKRAQGHKRRQSAAVKRGFLSKLGREGSGGSALYPPEGSENGAEPSAYVKMMSRCKVVDTTKLSKEETDAAMKAYAGGAAKPPSESLANAKEKNGKPSATRGSTETPSPPTKGKHGGGPAIRKGFFGSTGAGGTLYGDEGSREGEGVRKKERKAKADGDFERLVALADPAMGNGGREASDANEPDPLTEQLAQLAKIMGPDASFPPETRNATSSSRNSTSNTASTSNATTSGSATTSSSSSSFTTTTTTTTRSRLSTKTEAGPNLSSKKTKTTAKAGGLEPKKPTTARTLTAELQAAPTNTTPNGSQLLHESETAAEATAKATAEATAAATAAATAEATIEATAGATAGATAEANAEATAEAAAEAIAEATAEATAEANAEANAEATAEAAAEATASSPASAAAAATRIEAAACFTDKNIAAAVAAHSGGAKGEEANDKNEGEVTNNDNEDAAAPGAAAAGPQAAHQQEAATPRKEREPTYWMQELRRLPTPSPSAEKNENDFIPRERAPVGKQNRGIVVVVDLPDLVEGGTVLGTNSLRTKKMGSDKSLGGVDKDLGKVDNNLGEVDKDLGKVDKSSRGASLSAGTGTCDRGLASGDDDDDGDCNGAGAAAAVKTPGTEVRYQAGRESGKRRPTLSDIKLRVSHGTFGLKVPGVYQLKLALPFPVDPDRVTAKFSASSAILTVSIQGQ